MGKNHWEKGEDTCVKPLFIFTCSMNLDLHNFSSVLYKICYLFTVLCTAVYKSYMDSCHLERRETLGSIHSWCNSKGSGVTPSNKFCPVYS